MALKETFLDPKVLEKLGKMNVRVESLVVGILNGMHRSPHKGGAVEFSEYKEYSPGHEIRHIDWKVFAKSDKFYVKQFQDETNLRVYLVVDASGSMAYRGEDSHEVSVHTTKGREGNLSKLRYVSFLAATISYLFISQSDAVGLYSSHEDENVFLPASSRTKHLEDLFQVLDGLPGTGFSSLTHALKEVAERAKPRSKILVFSDMLEADEESMSMLAVLRKRKYDVSMFHVLDKTELEFPFEGMTNFVGLEGEGDLLIDPDDVRVEYKKLVNEHIKFIEDSCNAQRVQYSQFFTTDPIEEVVLEFLRGGH